LGSDSIYIVLFQPTGIADEQDRNCRTALLTVRWNWLLQGDTLGQARTPGVIPRSDSFV